MFFLISASVVFMTFSAYAETEIKDFEIDELYSVIDNGKECNAHITGVHSKCDVDGQPYTGYIEVDGKKRYFKQGMSVGWQKIDDNTYEIYDRNGIVLAEDDPNVIEVYSALNKIDDAVNGIGPYDVDISFTDVRYAQTALNMFDSKNEITNYVISRLNIVYLKQEQGTVYLHIGSKESFDKFSNAKREYNNMMARIDAGIQSTDNLASRLRVIHDNIVNMYTYNFEESETSGMTSTPLEGFLVDKKIVCIEYAYFFKFICDKYGIDCDVVAGTDGKIGHAWNYIPALDRSIDCTWDDTQNTIQWFLFDLSCDEPHLQYKFEEFK